MKYLHYLMRALGPFGVAGLSLLLCCAVFYLSVVKPAESEVTSQRDASQRMKSRSPYQPVSMDRREIDLRRFNNLFPPTEDIAHEMKNLWVNAAEFEIDLYQGEYRLESDDSGLARYRVTLPMRASYSQIRQFINFILKETPAISIDGLRFERKKIGETRLEAQLRLTLYFRPAAQP
ncbi:MAG: hypothetical protein K2Y31_06980 [Burkholderiales bacterium]|jgi:hypothetical protein|nr:hypothetical protein [Burkholderiales bacterium]